jgi:hypothetical protein
VQAIALTKTALPLPSSQARVAVWSGLIVSVHSWKASAATRALHSCARAASPIHGYEWPQRRNGIRRLTNSAPYRLWGILGKNSDLNTRCFHEPTVFWALSDQRGC